MANHTQRSTHFPVRPTPFLLAVAGIISAMLGLNPVCHAAVATRPAAPVSLLNLPYSVTPAYVSKGKPTLAVINGERLSEKKFVNSLILLNGVPLFQKWMQLTLLKQACDKAGLLVGPAQVQDQLNIAINSLAADNVPVNERLPVLAKLLAQRGENLLTFKMDLERNAYILALAHGHVHVTEKEITLAYEVKLGPKIEVRDIVVKNFEDAATVRHLIMDKHISAAVVAAKYSVDRQTGAKGGLELIPVKDSTLPSLFLSTARELRKGHLSPAIPLGNAYHLLWLVKKIPASKIPLSKVHDALKADLTRTLELQWGRRELARLMLAAKVKIENPTLDREWSQMQEAYQEQQRLMQDEEKNAGGTVTTQPAPAPAK